LEEHEQKVEALRGALIEGESSGEPQPFDAAAFKQRMSNSSAVNAQRHGIRP
jgi:antitoxin ParD1/3/4